MANSRHVLIFPRISDLWTSPLPQYQNSPRKTILMLFPSPCYQKRERNVVPSFAAQGQPRTSASLLAETETPRRFLRGDMRDPAAAARSDLFPSMDDRERAVLEGAASTSQGSVLQWHRAGPLSRHQLDTDFAAAA